jgi:ArsR family transcriptional regulator, cadmium/lead-responsive transcriptional repressor
MALRALDASQEAKLFRGLSNRSRRSIIRALTGGLLTVGDIVEVTGLRQPNVSNHLAYLRDCGLVVREPAGRFVRYALRDRRVASVLALVEQLLDMSPGSPAAAGGRALRARGGRAGCAPDSVGGRRGQAGASSPRLARACGPAAGRRLSRAANQGGLRPAG